MTIEDGMSAETFFITGATGSVGVEILRLLLQGARVPRLWAVIRAANQQDVEARWARLVHCVSDGQLTPGDLPDWKVVLGNVEEPGLGMSAEARAAIAEQATTFIHSAANVNFDEQLDVCRRINVEGTRYALELALSCRALERFAHVSSLYVAGRRSGVVLENELEHDAGFVTYGYEQSKYEAELLVREYMDRLPIAIYRLSLMLGREADGYVHDFGAIHRFLQYTFQGITPCLPAKVDCPLDFLPNDYSAKVMLDLLMNHFQKGSTYQLAAGRASITAQRWMDLTAEVFSQFSRGWQKGFYVTPDIVDWSHYRLYVRTIDTIDNPSLRRVTRVLDSCAEELFCPKVFDRTVVNQTLRLGPESVPDYERYYPKILEHCVSTKWGRQPRYEKI